MFEKEENINSPFVNDYDDNEEFKNIEINEEIDFVNKIPFFHKNKTLKELNSFETNIATEFEEKLGTDFKKQLKKSSYYNITKDFIEKKIDDFSIVLVGTPRSGKSSLINALCGRPIAEVSPGLDRCTLTIKKYPICVKYEDIEKRIIFYDTPGIENWEKDKFINYINNIKNDTKPICVLLCMSAGNFAVTKHISIFIESLIDDGIWVSLVITNMYNGEDSQYKALINSYENIAMKFGLLLHTDYNNDNEMEYKLYKHGLIIRVNSSIYINTRMKETKKAKNVDILIKLTLKNLDGEVFEAWLIMLYNNMPIWKKFAHNIFGFFTQSIPETLTGKIITIKDFFKNL